MVEQKSGYDYGKMRRIPVDPRWIEKVEASPRMVAEQGAGFMQGWGGPTQYRVLAQLPVEERLTYAAVLEGYTAPEEIEVVTGLARGEVSRGLAGLKRRGLVSEPKLGGEKL